jgi:rhodanese-related sulfurtransferase
MTKRIVAVAVFLLSVAVLLSPAAAADDLLKKMNDILQKAAAEGEYQIKAADLAKMIAEKKTDFVVVDVRIGPPAGPGQQGGKIPGAIWIPVDQILKDENIKKLPKDKKIILVCVTGQTTGLPILPLRALGYNAVSLKYGMSSWTKGYFGGQFIQKAVSEANYPTVP